MKIENIAYRLAGLTSNLSSLSPENDKYLDTIRRVLGYNLRNNRQDISALKLQSAELEFAPSKEKIQEFSKHAVSRLPKEDKYLIQRIEGEDIVPVVGVQMGDIRLPINPIETFDEVRWNQKPGEKIGPFLSEEGRSIWFDLYYYEDKLTVRSQSGSIPYFLFSKAKKNHWLDAFKNTQTVSLKAGHVWILGKLFTNDAGDNEYVGFNIKGGSFSLANKNQWNDQYLDFEGNFTGKLTIQFSDDHIAHGHCIAQHKLQSVLFRFQLAHFFFDANGFQAGQLAQSNFQNIIRLNFGNPELSHQIRFGVIRFTNDSDHFINVQQYHHAAFQDVQAFLHLIQSRTATTRDGSGAKLHPFGQ